MDSNCLLSRQPIYRSKVDVAAYEVRSHRVVGNEKAVQASDTARVIFNMLTDSALDHIVGEHQGFISLTPAALSEGLWKAIPKSRVVLSYFDNFLPSDDVAHHLSNLINQGYRVAISDQLCAESLDMLGERVEVIKLDVTKYLPADLEQRVQELRRYKSKLLADRVDTYDDLEFCKGLKLDLYQGHFLCRPTSASKKDVPASRLPMIRLLSKLQDPDIKMTELESVISQDVALSYKLLRYANSAAVALPRSVSSVGHAVRMVGLDMLKTWASVLLLSSVEDKPRELMNIALVRARMCEKLATSIKNSQKDSFLFAGLLSVLDALLDCPIGEALEGLPLSQEVREALTMRSGTIGQALRCTIAYERADWDEVQFYGLAPGPIREHYLDAIAWSRQLISGMAS